MPTLRPRKSIVKVETNESSPEPSPPPSPKSKAASKSRAKNEKKSKTESTTKNKTRTSIIKNEKQFDQEKIKAETIEAEDEQLVPYELSEKELKEINNAFDMNCSEDGEETLDANDLKTALRSLGYEPRADEIKKLFKLHSNKANKITRDGFQKIMAQKINSSPGTKDNMNDAISKVFNLLDLNKTGYITIENLKSISKELNEEITDEELLEMMTEADEDGDFKISKDEFVNIMKKTSLY